jgi:hypothetical protein
MLTEVAAAIEFLGRFAVFWAFILNPTFRRAEIEKWKQGTRLARCMDLVDGAITALVGLLPLAVVGAGVWLLA